MTKLLIITLALCLSSCCEKYDPQYRIEQRNGRYAIQIKVHQSGVWGYADTDGGTCCAPWDTLAEYGTLNEAKARVGLFKEGVTYHEL